MPKVDIDCKRLFSVTKTQLSASVSFLDKIKGALSIAPQKVQDTNAWTSFALAEMYSACSVWRATGSDDDKKYFQEVQKELREWLMQLASTLAKYKQLIEAIDQNKQTDSKQKASLGKEVGALVDKAAAKKGAPQPDASASVPVHPSGGGHPPKGSNVHGAKHSLLSATSLSERSVFTHLDEHLSELATIRNASLSDLAKQIETGQGELHTLSPLSSAADA